jgi:Ca-activated chloride channel family protein
MIILDASGSMRDEVDGREKFDIAKDVVESIVKKLGEGAQVGLRVYGHRLNALDDQADFDSELLVPLGPLKPATFMAKVRPLRCKGKTPLTLSMDETIRDISGVDPGLDLITIILTDGGESTRGAKPADAAQRLAAARKGMKVHVVGFDINNDEEREQLGKIAASGGGKYFQANKGSELMASLALATVGAAEYQLKDKSGKEVYRGKVGDRHELPEGKYTIAVEVDGRQEEKTVWINTEVVSHATLSLSRFLKKPQ